MIAYQAKDNKAGLWKKGEIAIIVEHYNTGKSLIFENGFHDGFSYDDLIHFMTEFDTNSHPNYNYHFKNVIQLDQDYKNGLFKHIFEYIKSQILKLKINTIIHEEGSSRFSRKV